MLSFGRRADVHADAHADVHADSHEPAWACERVQLQQKHRHTVTNAAAALFDVQGAVAVVHVCPLKSFSAPRVKHGNKGKQHIQKCQTTHLLFHVCRLMVTRSRLTATAQDRLIDTGCWRRQRVREAETAICVRSSHLMFSPLWRNYIRNLITQQTNVIIGIT